MGAYLEMTSTDKSENKLITGSQKTNWKKCSRPKMYTSVARIASEPSGGAAAALDQSFVGSTTRQRCRGVDIFHNMIYSTHECQAWAAWIL